jgi:hypothetical protein
MKRFPAFLLFALLALPALADDFIASNGRDSVRLTQGPCPKDILALMRPEIHDVVKAAVTKVNGKEFRGCWMVQPSGVVTLLYEDGDEGVVPLKDFKRAPGA